MSDTLTRLPALDTIGDLPLTTRAAILPELRRFAELPETIRIHGRYSELHVALNIRSDDTDLQPRFWFTRPNDIHPLISAMSRAIADGTFTLSTTVPTPEPVPQNSASADRAKRADAVAIMRRREAQALADREAAEQEARDLRVQLATLVAQATPAVTPWGPDHPEWMAFWRQAAADAEAAGNCGEYDRHAREMGGPQRSDLRYDGTGIANGRTRSYIHTVDVTVAVQFTVSVLGDEEISRDEIREAIANADLDAESLLDDALAHNYNVNWSVADSEEDRDAEASGTYWNNPAS